VKSLDLSPFRPGLVKATRITALVGAAIVALPLLAFAFDGITKSGATSIGFARDTWGGPGLVLGLIVLAAMLLLIGLFAGRHVLGLVAALVLGFVGTAVSAYGITHGGAAGPAPSILWWVLTAVSLASLSAGPAGARDAS
jgi:hypothetical protein